ncbi:hypothetical protein [Paenibacillus sp. ISL-20]|uniref:hypothetical protein n=1 Tax=Paenibacillus sp. ISL-20 TaxID=2819163 RepID=UPI001BE87C37|nr:hypothetical protein [Paenibacillus sp. ISL-20]MBT2765883.1 hypothetical protein [Paenibacillus sp. ISL-20]
MRFIYIVLIIATVTNTQTSFCYGVGEESKGTVAKKVHAIVAEAQPSQTQDKELLKRLEKLEPLTPTNIQTPFFQSPFPSMMQSTKEVIRTGFQLPFRQILNEPQWQRPLYMEQWHSTYSGGRWSYIPVRLFYAQHRIFTTSAVGLSNMYDFLHNLGLSDLNVEQKGATQEERVNEVVVVVMQAKIERVMTKGNQVVITAIPQRTGVQAITVNRLNMKLNSVYESIIFQLVTLDGDEIDYSIY